MNPVRFRESLVPGLGHLRRGFLLPAAVTFCYLGAWIAILIGRFSAIRKIAGVPTIENVIALIFLGLFPIGMMLYAHRDLRARAFPASREGMGAWALAYRKFRKLPRGVWGFVILGFIYMVAFLAPVLAPYDPVVTPRDTAVNKYRGLGSSVYIFGDTKRGEVYAIGYTVDGETLVLDRGPQFPQRRVPISRLGIPQDGWSREGIRTMTIAGTEVPYRTDFHLLGTDANGRDLLSRIIYGSRISLTIGFAAMAVAVTLGMLFGALAGYFGGFIDGSIMRLVDILLAFPRLLLLLLIISMYQGAGIFTIVVILGATGWMGVSRLVRAQFLQLKELDFAMAAKAVGAGWQRIIFRHLMPNAMAPVIVAATLRVGDTILVEAALSFLGMGVVPPTPTWGNIVNDGSDALRDAWWIATLPGFAIVVTVICFNLVGDALRDAMDPRQKA